ncbi:MAG: MFS transporter [Cyanobacteriota bacterium]
MINIKDHYKWIIFIITSLLYNLVYFHRVSTNAIADELIRDLKINATELGTMSSTYFLCYALLQPFIGILADKFGSKKVILASLSISVIGCVCFSFSSNFFTAFISRSLIGIGVAGVLVPSLKLYAQWFAPEQFARVSGLFLGLGHLGALIATTPLAYLAYILGWRDVFIVFALIGFIMLLITLFFLHNRNTKYNENIENNNANSKISTIDTIKYLFKKRNFWLLAFIFFATFGAYVSFQGLWSTKYLICLKDLTATTANNLILFIPLGVTIGAFASGFVSDNIFRSRKKPLTIGLIITLICWVIITFWIQHLSDLLLIFIFFIMGLAGGQLLPMIFIIIKDDIPERIVGTSLGLINPAYFLGIFFYQIITGIILDINKVNGFYTEHSYLVMMIFCLATIFITTITSIFIKETFPEKIIES